MPLQPGIRPDCYSPGMHTDDDLRYPIGKFSPPPVSSVEQRRDWIARIDSLPTDLQAATRALSAKQLDTPYRPGGWTMRQVVHHIADSHMNAVVRFRLALTEDAPVIKPYREDFWAELPDAKTEDVTVSLALLEALHRRWTALLRQMTESQFERTYRHPEVGEMKLFQVLALYAWHSNHHLAHIANLRTRSQW